MSCSLLKAKSILPPCKIVLFNFIFEFNSSFESNIIKHGLESQDPNKSLARIYQPRPYRHKDEGSAWLALFPAHRGKQSNLDPLYLLSK